MAAPCCAQGKIHTRTEPVGKVEKIHGFDCYVTGPPDGSPPTALIVYIPDAFGWEFVNNRILADAYAQSGFLVYLPEFMNGGALAPSVMSTMEELSKKGFVNNIKKVAVVGSLIPSVVPFFVRTRPAVSKPKVWSFIEACKSDPKTKDLNLGAAGFCWGGKHVFLLCGPDAKTKDGERLIKAGFTAHPSLLSLPAEAEAVEVPLSNAQSEFDQMVSKPQGENMKEIFERKTKEGLPCEFQWYEGAKHGFAVRHDENEVALKRAERAREQAVNWFARHLTK